ncbi:MAG: hypothetical protein ABIR47_10495 [Candidatus Kapaibacterium sp.]
MAKATKSIVKSSGPKPLLRSTGAIADVAATPSSLVVGFGASFKFGDKIVAVNTDDITKLGLTNAGLPAFKFTLSAPVELGTVADGYQAIHDSDLGQKLGLPAIDWTSSFLKPIGTTAGRIDTFQIDTTAGLLVLGLTFTFDLTLVGSIKLDTASIVINYKSASA